jgi:hypothetical protein
MGNDLTGAGGQFGSLLMPGDIIRILLPNGSNDRMVIRIISDAQITISQPLDLQLPVPFPAPTFQFFRVAQEPQYAYSLLAKADDSLNSADSVMNHAADLAATLCIGAASQLVETGDLAANRVQSVFDLQRVFQVFRNWNLDRRRENEWRMLVLGNATSEKRGDPSAADPALGDLPSSWHMFTPEGERTANQLGWLPLLRTWLDMAGRPGTDTKATVPFRPGNPTNLDLSRGLAFLFDMRDPVPNP